MWAMIEKLRRRSWGMVTRRECSGSVFHCDPLDSRLVRRDRLIIALVYALSWGALVVNRGLYWDDWTLVGLSPEALVRGFGELGMPWAGAFYAALFALPLPGLVGHILAFGAYLLSALILHAVLLRI